MEIFYINEKLIKNQFNCNFTRTRTILGCTASRMNYLNQNYQIYIYAAFYRLEKLPKNGSSSNFKVKSRTGTNVGASAG